MKTLLPTKNYPAILLILWMTIISAGNIQAQGLKSSISLPLSPGWNWVSFNLSNPDMSIGTVLGSLTLTNGDYIKNQTVSATWYDGFGWFGELTTIVPDEMYKFKIAQANEPIYEGNPVDPCTPIPVETGWNWIGYPPQTALPIEEALASINPVEGDYIKSQDVSATYYDGFGWFGELTHLEPLKGYMLKTSHAESLVFTACDPGCTFTDARDGHEYSCIEIGTQTWMADNLAWLPSVSPSANGTDTDPYNYVYEYEGTDVSAAKAEANYDTYGVLYNWPAAMTACPDGWHLPSDEEWTTLTTYLIDNSFGYGGSGNDIGKSMASTTGWTSSATPGEVGNDQASNNNSGFNGLPGGSCSTYSGFKELGSSAGFWSSTPDGSYNAMGKGLNYQYDLVTNIYAGRRVGFSVRCLQND